MISAISASCQKNNTRLYEAVIDRDLKKIEKLCEKGADPTVYVDGNIAIVKAAEYHPQALAVLLNYFDNIEQELGADKLTLIQWATGEKNYKSVAMLIKAGADLSVTGPYGLTLLMFATRGLNDLNHHSVLETSKLLISAGVKIDTKDNKGNTAYDIAMNYEWDSWGNKSSGRKVPLELINLIAPQKYYETKWDRQDKAKKIEKEKEIQSDMENMSSYISSWRRNLEEGDDVRMHFSSITGTSVEDWYISTIYSNGDYLLKSNNEYGTKKVSKSSLFPPSWSKSKINKYLKN